MTIIGLGLDATEIPRIARLVEQYGDRFIRRVFTDGEIAYCSRKARAAESYAARFAAKEAAMKALGSGRALGVAWRDIEVVRRDGPPHLTFRGGAARRLAEIGGASAHLTLTHTSNLALAHVILLGDTRG